MDLKEFYSDKDRLSYNPHGVILSRPFPKSLLSFDDRFLEASNTLSEVIKTVHNKTGKKVKVLDIGVGDGVYEGIIFDEVSEFCDFYGVDLSGKQIKRASKYLKEGKAVDLDTEKLPYKKETFDIVLISEVLEHVFFPEKMIDEAKRVLKKGGYFVMTYPNVGALQIRMSLFFSGNNPMVNYSSNKEHIRFYRDRDMDSLVKLEKISHQGLGSLLFDKWTCGVKIPTPRFMQKLFNRYVPSLALGHLSVYKK